MLVRIAAPFSIMKYIEKILLPTLMLLWATVYYVEVMGKPQTARVLIQPVYYFLLVVYVYLCYRAYREYRSMNAEKPAPPSELSGNLRTALLWLLITLLYIVSIKYLGFFTSTLFFLAFSFYSLGLKRRLLACGVSFLLTASLYWVFKYLLGVPLPPGVW